MSEDRAILVTGLPRSGTSWVGKMLQASGEVVYVNEPLNPRHPPGHSPGVLNAEVTHRYEYICPDNDERWAVAFSDTVRLRYHLMAELRRNHALPELARLAKYFTAFTVGRVYRRRALIDDPFATLSAAWFARRLGLRVIVCVRHPVAFVGSWRRLGWQARPHELLDQPLLVRDLLGPYAAELSATADMPDPVARAATLWRVTYAALERLDASEPGLLHMQRYEDLATEAETGFRRLYDLCGLIWTDRVRQRIVSATTAHGSVEPSHVWSIRGGLSRTAFRPIDSRAALASFRDRLSEHEISQVREMTFDVATRYYEDREGFAPV